MTRSRAKTQRRRKYTSRDRFPEDLVERAQFLLDVGKRAGQRWVGHAGITYMRRHNTHFENSPHFPDGIVIGETVVQEKSEDGKWIDSTARHDLGHNQMRALSCLSRGSRYLSMPERINFLKPYKDVQNELRRHGKPGVKVQEEVMGQILSLTANEPKLREAFLAAVKQKDNAHDNSTGDAMVDKIVNAVMERLSNASVDADGRLVGDAATLDPRFEGGMDPDAPPAPVVTNAGEGVELLAGGAYDDSDLDDDEEPGLDDDGETPPSSNPPPIDLGVDVPPIDPDAPRDE